MGRFVCTLIGITILSLAAASAEAGDWLAGRYYGTSYGCTSCASAWTDCGDGAAPCGCRGMHGRCGCRGRHGCGGEGCGYGCRNRYEGTQNPWYNCGCKGSYKFPVPPLSTYYWPGVFAHERITDYHSPWRFPPIAPYSDEPTVGVPQTHLPALEGIPAATVRPISAVRIEPAAPRSGGIEPMSAKMQRLAE